MQNIEGSVAGELPPKVAADDNSFKSLEGKQDEALDWWHMSLKEMIENSPSRKDGIDWKKETSLRKSYSRFLKKVGKGLRVPQIIIATAIVLCHRFFLRQSHAKNDRWTIATACMSLASKVLETRPVLKDIICISYKTIHKKDPEAVHRIQQKEVYEQQRGLVLLAERLVNITLDFNLSVKLPYDPLVEVIKKLNVGKPELAQVAWNFVNDGMTTLLCLEFKPHQIAVGAILLAAKFLNVEFPSDSKTVWWQKFDVTPRQLEEVCNQLIDLYDWNSVQTPVASEVKLGAEAETGATARDPAVKAEEASEQVSSHSAPMHTSAENLEVQVRGTGNQSIDGSAEVGGDITDSQNNSELLPQKDNEGELTKGSDSGTEPVSAGEHDRIDRKNEAVEVRSRDDSESNKSSCDEDRHLELGKGLQRRSLVEVLNMIDLNKVNAALKRWRKGRGETMLKEDEMDEDDLIEKELEDGIELTVEDAKNKETQSSSEKPDHLDSDKDHDKTSDVKHEGVDAGIADEGKLIDDASPPSTGGAACGEKLELLDSMQTSTTKKE